MTITNDGQSDKHPRAGDYNVKLMRRGTTQTVSRKGRVLNHARQAQSIWKLVKKALQSVDM